MTTPIFQVDSFTDEVFKGNPAGVCVLNRPAGEEWMQKAAQELNTVRTAFLHKQGTDFNLRWFAPGGESDLCGHATLAAAHILWEHGFLKPDEEARFHTRSGLLKARYKGDWIELDFPSLPPRPLEKDKNAWMDITSFLDEALQVTPLYIGKNLYAFLVEVDCEKTVRDIKPDFTKLASIPGGKVMVTARADTPEYDFTSRFFTRGVSDNEDQATGSAHCCLGPYWGAKLGKDELVGYQASARGGVVKVRLAGDRVSLGGKAVTVFKGELTV